MPKKSLNLAQAAAELTRCSGEQWTYGDVLLECSDLPLCIVISQRRGRLVWVSQRHGETVPHPILSPTPQAQINGVLRYGDWRIRVNGFWRVGAGVALALRKDDSTMVSEVFLLPENEARFLADVRAKRPEVPVDAAIAARLDEPLHIKRWELCIKKTDLATYLRTEYGCDLSDQPNTALQEKAEPVTASTIIGAFQIKPDAEENIQWWKERLGNAKRYGLLECRAAVGTGSRGSTWRPEKIAEWLADKNHMDAARILAALQNHFPECRDTIYTFQEMLNSDWDFDE